MRAKELIEAAEPSEVLLASAKFLAGPDADDCPHHWTAKPPYPPGMWDDRPVKDVSSSLFTAHYHFSGDPYEMTVSVFEVYGFTDDGKFRKYVDGTVSYRAEITNNRGLVVHRAFASESPHIVILNILYGVASGEMAKVRKALYDNPKIVAAVRSYQRHRTLAGLA